MPSRVPTHIAQSIESDYFGFIKPIYIVTRHPEVARSTIYLLYKNLKEYRAAYLTVQALPPVGRTQLITPAIEDNVVELLMRAPTHYLNEI
jgi:hypothetical protein